MQARWDELLRQDHEVTERVFAAMETLFASASGPSREQVGLFVDDLRDDVDRCHNQKEELQLFPRLEAKGMPRHGGPLGVMLQEHERAQEILSRLRPLGLAARHRGGAPAARRSVLTGLTVQVPTVPPGASGRARRRRLAR